MCLNDKTDEELVKLSLNWNIEGFKEIINRYEKPLMNYISRLVDTTIEQKEDLLQEIFIKIYKYLNSFDLKLKFSNWIYRITHNYVIDFIRKQERDEKYSFFINEEEKENFWNEIQGDSDIEKEYLLKERNEIIQKILNSLSEIYKEVLILKYFEFKDYKDISDILKIPEGTVATYLNKAKKQFKEKALYYKLNEYEW